METQGLSTMPVALWRDRGLYSGIRREKAGKKGGAKGSKPHNKTQRKRCGPWDRDRGWIVRRLIMGQYDNLTEFSEAYIIHQYMGFIMGDSGFEIAIIDDEDWVRRGLVSKTIKCGLPIKKIQDFAQGNSLLEYIKAGGRPDIMLCDVRMPELDGLELSAISRALVPDLEIIIASGYGEFEYARRAIQVGVSHYLLKPIDETELRNALKASMDAITRFRQNRKSQDQLRRIERGNKARSYIGAAPPDPGGTRKKGLDPVNLRELFPDYQVFRNFIAASFDLSHSGKSDLDFLIDTKGPNWLNKKSLDNSVVYSCLPGEYVLLFLDLEPEEKLHAFIAALAEELGEGNPAFSAGLSNPGGKPGEAVAEARYLMKHRILLKTNSLVNSVNIEGRDDSYAIPDSRLSALKYVMEERNEKSILSILDNIKDELYGAKITYRQLETLCYELLRILNENYGLQPYKFVSLEDLFLFLKKLFLKHVRSWDALGQRNKNSLINNITQVIDRHFNEYLTLEMFAADYRVNVSSLSASFKEVMGVNFHDYLSGVRIRNAKKFLASGRFKIREVAERAGYSNGFYFAKVFKKTEGITPSEFIERQKK
jgi:two-component system response regulator YesN